MDVPSEPGSQGQETPGPETSGPAPPEETAGTKATHAIDKSSASRLEDELSVPVAEPRTPRNFPRAFLWLICLVLFAIAYFSMARACRAWRHYNPPPPAVLNVPPRLDR